MADYDNGRRRTGPAPTSPFSLSMSLLVHSALPHFFLGSAQVLFSMELVQILLVLCLLLAFMVALAVLAFGECVLAAVALVDWS